MEHNHHLGLYKTYETAKNDMEHEHKKKPKEEAHRLTKMYKTMIPTYHTETANTKRDIIWSFCSIMN